MHGTSCGGGCGCGRGRLSEPGPRTPSAVGKWIVALVGIGIVGASTIALTQAPPAPPAPPVAPARPAPAAPAADTEEAPAPAGSRPVAPGAVRHGIPEPIAKPAGVVRIATYNVENLFAAPKNADGTPGTPRANQPVKPLEHQKAAAEAIRKIDADILGLQEIESLETLTAFRDTYLSDLGYAHIASIDAGDDRGIEQSVLSRYPIVEVKNWPHLPIGDKHNANRTEKDRVAGGPIEFKRTPLMVTVEVPPAKDAGPGAKPYRVTLFVVHFKSGRNDGYWRDREATKTAALAREIESKDPAANIVILGDFNAKPQERPVRNVLSAGFIDAFGDLPEDAKYQTHASDRAIDHILLNPNAAAELVKETRFVMGVMQRAAGVDWRTTEPPAGYASDHYPVVIDLKTVDQPVAAPAPAPASGQKP